MKPIETWNKKKEKRMKCIEKWNRKKGKYVAEAKQKQLLNVE
jgi:hypothetical protein